MILSLLFSFIQGFIVTVLSKLECTCAGWNLTVKVNDGTASISANIHDKVIYLFVSYYLCLPKNRYMCYKSFFIISLN